MGQEKIRVLNLSGAGTRKAEQFNHDGNTAYNNNGSRRIATLPGSIFNPNQPRRFKTYDDWEIAGPPPAELNYRKTSFLRFEMQPTVIKEAGFAFPIMASEPDFDLMDHIEDSMDQSGLDHVINKLGRRLLQSDFMTKVLLMLSAGSLILTLVLAIVVVQSKASKNSNSQSASPTPHSMLIDTVPEYQIGDLKLVS